MSKKNKNKFKKQLKSKILQEITSETSKDSIKPPTTNDAPNIGKEINISQSNATVIPELQNLPLIKMDLVKTGIVVAILALIIVTLAILDGKYQILVKFGDILFKTFNIN